MKGNVIVTSLISANTTEWSGFEKLTYFSNHEDDIQF